MKGEMKYTPEDRQSYAVKFAEAYVPVARGVQDPCFPPNPAEINRHAAEDMLRAIRRYKRFPSAMREKMGATRDQVIDLERRCTKALEFFKD